MTHQGVLEAATAAKVEVLDTVAADAGLAARLESDPRSVSAQKGRQRPDVVEISVVRDSDTVKHVHIRGARLRSFWHFPTATCAAPEEERRRGDSF